MISLKSSKPSDTDGIKLIAGNRRAYHEYFMVETLEVGIVLLGSELRPCREGKVNLQEAYAEVDGAGQLWLFGASIAHNPFSNQMNHDPFRKRRLMAHKKQILKLGHKVQASGHTLIPLKMYFRDGRVKVEIALAKGKRQYDKRETLAKKDLKREMDRELSGKR